MNSNRNPDRVHDYLQRLPAASPPPALRLRVLAAVAAAGGRRHRPWRQWRWPLGLAAAAAVAAMAVGLLRQMPVALAPESALARSQALETRLLAAPAADDPLVAAGIGALDADLAAAYRRGAGQGELDALWEARARALEAGLVAQAPLPTRI
ncbi:MAG TPA: hypothetical protein VFG21_02725 [Xanthomonadaceae bacterium]|nr:hypothetical protein [Xanthomonadaceae bacterium]